MTDKPFIEIEINDSNPCIEGLSHLYHGDVVEFNHAVDELADRIRFWLRQEGKLNVIEECTLGLGTPDGRRLGRFAGYVAIVVSMPVAYAVSRYYFGEDMGGIIRSIAATAATAAFASLITVALVGRFAFRKYLRRIVHEAVLKKILE